MVTLQVEFKGKNNFTRIEASSLSTLDDFQKKMSSLCGIPSETFRLFYIDSNDQTKEPLEDHIDFEYFIKSIKGTQKVLISMEEISVYAFLTETPELTKQSLKNKETLVADSSSLNPEKNEESQVSCSLKLEVKSSLVETPFQHLTEHKNIKCDECNSDLIIGVRLVCLVCEDLNWCLQCFSKLPHLHPMMTLCLPVSDQLLNDTKNNFRQSYITARLRNVNQGGVRNNLSSINSVQNRESDNKPLFKKREEFTKNQLKPNSGWKNQNTIELVNDQKISQTNNSTPNCQGTTLPENTRPQTKTKRPRNYGQDDDDEQVASSSQLNNDKTNTLKSKKYFPVPSHIFAPEMYVKDELSDEDKNGEEKDCMKEEILEMIKWSKKGSKGK